MRCLLLCVSRAALVCLFMAILQVHALVVTPSEALSERHRTLEVDDAFSERSPLGFASYSAGSLPVSSIPTVTRLLPSHAAWYAQVETTPVSLGHVPVSRLPFSAKGPGTCALICSNQGKQRILDNEARDDEDNVLRSHHHSPSLTVNDRESDPRRRRPGGVDVAGRYASEDSKVSVLAVAVVVCLLARRAHRPVTRPGTRFGYLPKPRGKRHEPQAQIIRNPPRQSFHHFRTLAYHRHPKRIRKQNTSTVLPRTSATA
ncbi:hypothetical protein LXA43DRAFT_197141 [Ganoderma leucocontextum]|nr:hypothetical protein LXA43DRAFT_197141 [Ganoderma leucocontextum]